MTTLELPAGWENLTPRPEPRSEIETARGQLRECRFLLARLRLLLEAEGKSA
jgi:hypothetical protein